MANYTFEIDLVFEPDCQSFVVKYDVETDDPQALLDGDWPDGFSDNILDSISIVPLSYEED